MTIIRKKKRRPSVKKMAGLLASTSVPFFILPVLMLMLTAGTLSQRWLGLYDAQKMFFVSPVFWLGPVPLPGGSTLLVILALSLTLKFVFFSPWKWKHAGSHLAHLGVLVLLFGGALTSFYAQESYLVIPEGEKQNIIEDYHQREFSVTRNGETLFRIPHQKLSRGMPLPDSRFNIISLCRNCRIEKRSTIKPQHKGMAAAVALRESPPSKQDEENLYGLTLAISGLSEDIDGIYIVFDAMPRPLRLESHGDAYEISYNRRKNQLPFSVQLTKFEKDFYPGTDKPRHFASNLVIEDEGLSWPAHVEMNAPLRYKGYTFFQSSFIEDEQGNMSTVLAVVKNPSWPFPYIGTGLLAIGLLMHLIITLKERKRWSWLGLLCLLALVPNHAHATDLSGFEKLPVLHEGRIKPLDSFARIQQRLIADNDNQNAVSWLAESIFDPARAATRPLFEINNPALRHQLGLTEKKYFSLEEISSGLAATQSLIPELIKNPEKLTPEQKELLRLHEKSFAYSQLLGSLTLLLPLSVPGADNPRWIDLRKQEEDINNKVRAVVAKKGEDFDAFSEDEKTLVILGMKMSQLASAGRLNTIFKIVPPGWNGQTAWLSPWETVHLGMGSPETAGILKSWQDMADGYREGDAQKWIQGLHSARQAVSPHVSSWRLCLELSYNKARPFLLASILYALALGFFLHGKNPLLPLWLGATGSALHLTGIVVRIAILSRPPVGTLYESLIFVGFIAVAVALLAQLKKRNQLLLGCGIFVALLTLLAAPAFAPAGDNMEMLVAVLNTGFWLSTHVICITAGYGVSILAAALAHVALYQKNNRALVPVVYKTLLGALFLTAFGTVLGGIWADQSWGRFWGWDPKENGALLIVLWILWILHGKFGGHMKEKTWLGATAALGIVVAVSWIGVNLLNIGLHSYGFTSSMAAGFAVFCLLESSLIVFLLQRKPR